MFDFCRMNASDGAPPSSLFATNCAHSSTQQLLRFLHKIPTRKAIHISKARTKFSTDHKYKWNINFDIFYLGRKKTVTCKNKQIQESGNRSK